MSVSLRSLNVRVPPEDVVLNWSCSPGGAVYVVNRVSGSFWVVREYATRPGDWEARRACFADVREAWIDQADHMLHHDQPEQVAALIEDWFTT